MTKEEVIAALARLYERRDIMRRQIWKLEGELRKLAPEYLELMVALEAE